MKKVAMMMIMALVMVMMTACGSDKAKAVAEKVKANQELTEEDYNVAYEYLDKAFTDVAKIAEDVSAGKVKPEEATKKINDLEKNYPYIQEMVSAMEKAPESMQAKQEQLGMKFLGAAMTLAGAGVNMDALGSK